MDVVDKVFEIACRTPDAPAIIYDLKPVSYRALYRMITAMRGELAARGLRPGGVAVVWIHSILLSWVVNLGLRTLGLTTVSIRSAAEFEGFVGLDIVAVVTSAKEHVPDLDPAIAPGAARIGVDLPDWTAEDDGGELVAPPRTPPGDHILLTSGTTGNYKMMVVDSRAQIAVIQAGLERYRRDPDGVEREISGNAINILDLGLWTAVGYNFPLGVWMAGATVIIHQGADKYRSLELPGITSAMLTPGLLAQVMAEAPASLQRNDKLTLMLTGGPLSLALANQVKARLTKRIVTSLGSTESGGWATTEIRADEDLRWHRLHSWRTVEVVDEEDRPLPPNQLGQVRVLLDNSFTGYLNDPDATASFVKGAYFYPGDLGVLDGKGRIALHGRVTDVLNIMGDKRPSGPYEQALQDALGLDGVCVLTEQGADREEQLHVVLETAEPIDEERLREAALTHLKGFPAARFHFLAKFPRNHMGKVERFKLKQRLIEQQQAQTQA